jgi:hypothetical protein
MLPQAKPWITRRMSSATRSVANPKAATAPANTINPTSVVRRTPTRAASQPPSSEPGMTPAEYAAASIPTAGLDAPSVCA